MAVAPLNPVSKALEDLRTLISNSIWFQTWTGTADAVAAKQRVLIGEMGVNLISVILTSNVATFTTREAHNFTPGQVVRVEQTPAPYEGNLTIVATATDSTFTAAIVAADQGIGEMQEGMVLPCIKPFCALMESGDEALRVKTIGTDGAAILSGKIDIFLVALMDSNYVNDPENAKVTMTNEAFGFMKALKEMSGSGDYLTLNEISIQNPAAFIRMSRHSNNQNRFEEWEASFRVSWGLEG